MHFEIILIASLASIACAIPGVFLTLKNMCMMSDSITHTVLLGIVLAFFVVGDLSSPFLIIGASIMGLLTVYLTESLNQSKLMSEESAIGIVFPFLFSIAIILITLFASNVHLDTDAVLLGELAFIPFDRLFINGIDFGAKAIYTCLALLLINIISTLIFYKEIKLSIFDYTFANIMGFSPIFLHYLIMTQVSVSAVITFNVVGSILVVAFMSIPALCAYLAAKDLKQMLILSIAFSLINSISGCVFAFLLDVSISGSIAVFSGITFLLIFLFAKNEGLISSLINKSKRKEEFLKGLVLYNINNEKSLQDIKNICKKDYLTKIISKLEKEGFIKIEEDKVILIKEKNLPI